ncbi:MAG: hypothetical protein V1875_02515 [Candidatus Altiarchaeota archaeon]
MSSQGPLQVPPGDVPSPDVSPHELHEAKMYAVIRALVPPGPQAQAYTDYATASFTPAGLSGYLAKAPRTGEKPKFVFLDFSSPGYKTDEVTSQHRPAPFTLVPIALANEPDGKGTNDPPDIRVIIQIPAGMVGQAQKALEGKVFDKWHGLGLPATGQSLNYNSAPTQVQALAELKERGVLCDKMSVRNPNPQWPPEYMRQLAEAMLERLNVDKTIHPIGASVLIGHEPKFGLYQPHEQFIDVFKRTAAEQGFEVFQSSTHNVAGEGRPAELMYLRRRGKPPEKQAEEPRMEKPHIYGAVKPYFGGRTLDDLLGKKSEF